MRIAGIALALAFLGCATAGRPEGSPLHGDPTAGRPEGSPLHGVAAVVFRAPGTDGRVAAPGTVRSTEGRPVSPGVGLSLDLLPETWIGSFRTDTQALPEDLEPAGARAAVLQSWEVAAGPKVFESPALRLDAFAGARAYALRVAESASGLPSDDREREAWMDPIVGLRASVPFGPEVSLRFRGDTALGNSGSENAWRASAAGIFTLSGTVSLSIGWETSSVHFDRGGGGDRFLYDATLSGPFLALELRF